jgi:hypothetical protein
MTDRHVQSVASREAVLKSGRLRIRIVLSCARSSRVGGCTSYPATAIDWGWRLTFAGSKDIFAFSPKGCLWIGHRLHTGDCCRHDRGRNPHASRSGTAQGRDATLNRSLGTPNLALVRPITQSLVPSSMKVLKSPDGTSLRIKPAEIRTTGRFFGTVKLWPHGDRACLAGGSCFEGV